MKTRDVEWIIVYDGDKVDTRILQYEEDVPIRLFHRPRKKEDAYASELRNIGMDNAKGKYLYFLDDDNLMHPKLYEKILKFEEKDKVLVFNQFGPRWNRRIKELNLNRIARGYIDTAQLVVPRKYRARWDNSEPYFDEVPYFKHLVNEAGRENIKWINRLYTYRNYLRRYAI